MCCADLPDQGNGIIPDGIGTHVGQAIDDEDGGVDFDEKFADLRFHTTIAGEAEIDDGAVKASAQNGGMDHAGTRGTGAMSDGRAVEYDRAFGARRQGLKLAAGGDADGEGFHSVVEGQIDSVFAVTGSETVDNLATNGLFGGSAYAGPTPLSVFIAGIEVEPTGSDGRHVDAVEPVFQQIVIGPDGRRIGFEPDHHAGAVAAEFPDAIPDGSFRPGRKAVEPALTFKIGPRATFDAPSGDIVPR